MLNLLYKISLLHSDKDADLKILSAIISANEVEKSHQCNCKLILPQSYPRLLVQKI